MKKRFCVFLVALCMCLGLYQPDMAVWAATGSTSLSVSGSNVNIGDTVTVSAKASGPSGEQVVATMTLSWDSSVFQLVSCSTTYGGGGNSVTVATDSFNVTLKAVSAGTSALSLSGSDGFSYNDAVGELDSISGSSASVTVKNAAGATGTTTGSTTTGGTTAGSATTTGSTTSTDGTQSADNSLKSLTISPGTLSPAFSGQTTSYTATVGSDVTSIAVSAVPVNANAVVESVTGNDNLKDGVNTIKIVVKAENGVTATYTIKVTKQGGDTQAEEVEVQEEETSESTEETAGAFVINGVSYEISEDFTEEDIPTDFTESTVSYHGSEYKGVSFSKGTLNMLWMKQTDAADAEGRFFIYDETCDGLYSFVKMGNDTRYAIAILAPADVTMPENYVQTSLMVDDVNSITAYQKAAEEETETVSDFYIFYGINHDGTTGWYQYDALEGTYQRLATAIDTEEETASSSDMEYLQTEYDALLEKYDAEKTNNRNLIAVLIFIVAVLVIIIINLLIHRFRKPDDFDDDDFDGDDGSYDDSYEDDEELDEEVVDRGKNKEEEPRERIRVRERKPIFVKIKDDLEEDLEEEDAVEESSEEDLEEDLPEEEPVRSVAPAPKEKKKDRQKTADDLEIIDFNDL